LRLAATRRSNEDGRAALLAEELAGRNGLGAINRAVDDATLDTLRRVPLFADLDPVELRSIADAMHRRIFHAGETVTAEGGAGDGFFVVVSGEAEVTVQGQRRGTVEPGDFFGEIALLRDVPRTATVRAIDELVLYALERDDFLAAVTGHAPSRAAADTIVAARLPAGAAL
jgi:CRP-like cAMP-binding protein